MKTTTYLGQEVKEKLKKGINIIREAVGSTMGPYGRNVLYKNEYGSIQSTKDGVSVARMIKQLEDPIENFGVQIIKQASIKTVEKAGDGTTTSTILAAKLAIESLNLTTDHLNVTEIKRGIEHTASEIISELKRQSKDIESESQLLQIACLSANKDEEIGNLVTTAINKVGRDGIVTVEESRSGDTSLEIVEGIQFDRGYKSPYFVTNNNNMQCVLNDSLILIYDKKITYAKDLLPILESVSQKSKSLVIIAEDISDEVLSLLIVNKMRGILKVVAIKAPEFGERRQLVLEDIATITGGTVISPDKGMRLDRFDTTWFGEARLVTCGRDNTTIIDGKGSEEDILNRVNTLKDQLINTSSKYEIEKLQERIAKMSGGVAIINVGGSNEIEIKEKKDRVEDALNATKAALEEGILPGSGIALINASRKIETDKTKQGYEYTLGRELLLEVCYEPFKHILKNAGLSYDKWINLVGESKIVQLSDKQIVNAYENGIIDPTKVVINALKNAVSAAMTLLLTECIIVNEDKKENNDLSENFD